MAPKKLVVKEALDLICGPRMANYGPPQENIGDIAAVWTPYVRRALECKESLNATDVCMMMIMLKCIRQVRGFNRDSVVDIAGYAELAEVLNDKEAFVAFVLHAAGQLKNRKERGRFVLKFLKEEKEA